MTVKGHVRTSQLITTYGVGSMVASGDESFIVAGIEDWDTNPDFEIHEPRLEKMLGVSRFMRPPSTGESDSFDVPVRRFPKYHSCPSCHRLEDIAFFKTPFGGHHCTLCDEAPALVPSRFVVACEEGHLADFPFYQWVHDDHAHEESAGKAKLFLKTLGQSGGLRDVVISCSCGAKRSMDGAFGKSALRKIKNCSGEQPWSAGKSTDYCGNTLNTVQRGASNVWFAETTSAISIPPWSDSAFKILNRHWPMLRGLSADLLPAVIAGSEIADEEHPVDELVAAALYRQAQERGEIEVDEVKPQEYEALVKGAAEKNRHDQFVCVRAEDPGDVASEWFPMIKQVTRLREVRVLRGFSRLKAPKGSIDPDSGEKGTSNVVDLPGRELQWLPAIEISGEGVFLELESERLRAWEQLPEVQSRVARLADRFDPEQSWEKGLAVTPRYVLLHTLSHSLIDQWALESGYAASALTERLYVTDKRAGILIYTATSDSAGSLGGVVAMTDDKRLDSSLAEAIRRASWCSSDPLCIETATQGADAMNLAACHSCCLLPETSCEHRNMLLDRAVLVGIPGKPSVGFFSELLD